MNKIAKFDTVHFPANSGLINSGSRVWFCFLWYRDSWKTQSTWCLAGTKTPIKVHQAHHWWNQPQIRGQRRLHLDRQHPQGVCSSLEGTTDWIGKPVWWEMHWVRFHGKWQEGPFTEMNAVHVKTARQRLHECPAEQIKLYYSSVITVNHSWLIIYYHLCNSTVIMLQYKIGLPD